MCAHSTTHCEINGHHEADLATSSDVVNKTERRDGSAGRYKLPLYTFVYVHEHVFVHVHAYVNMVMDDHEA